MAVDGTDVTGRRASRVGATGMVPTCDPLEMGPWLEGAVLTLPAREELVWMLSEVWGLGQTA